MPDIATAWNAEISRGDYELVPPGVLRSDQDLGTAVMLSLFSDRTCEPDDVPPDGGGRRGWWGDAFRTYPLGSRLWLLSREKESEQTRLRAESYGREALRWMIREEIASATEVSAAWTAPGRLELDVVIVSPPGTRIGWRFAIAWGQLAGLELISGVII